MVVPEANPVTRIQNERLSCFWYLYICSFFFLPFSSPSHFYFSLTHSFILSFTPCSYLSLIYHNDREQWRTKVKIINIWKINIVTAMSDWSQTVWQKLVEGGDKKKLDNWTFLLTFPGVDGCVLEARSSLNHWWTPFLMEVLMEKNQCCHKILLCGIELKDLWKVDSYYLLQVSWESSKLSHGVLYFTTVCCFLGLIVQ